MNKKASVWNSWSNYLVVLFLASLIINPAFTTQGFANSGQTISQDFQSSSDAPFSPQALCTPDTSNMIAYWPLDDRDGATTFIDVFGAHHGTCTGDTCPDRVTGILNGAFNFVTRTVGEVLVGDKVSVPDHDIWDRTGTQSFSAEAWVNIPASQNCTGRKVIIGRRDSPSAWWLGCGGETITELNKAVFKLRDNSAVENSAIGTTDLNDGQWHHVVGVYEATVDQIRVYVDGVKEGETTQNFTGDFSGVRGLNIGWFDISPWYYMTGQIDEVALYNKALTLEDIHRHYNGGRPVSYCNVGPIYLPVVSNMK
jgi:hypothetical protein